MILHHTAERNFLIIDKNFNRRGELCSPVLPSAKSHTNGRSKPLPYNIIVFTID